MKYITYSLKAEGFYAEGRRREREEGNLNFGSRLNFELPLFIIHHSSFIIFLLFSWF
jgi:hypothetical protein